MLQMEYVRNLNCNYERILLDEKPEEKRYQYCILNRGGIKGLLPCSLRYINGSAYLYYDISSKQNVAQLYGNRCVTRAWIVDFFWNMRRIRMELERFLLDSKNILWFPEQIFQDLESNVFSFLYVPYYEGESGILKLMDFLIDRMDYEDEKLVECVYGMYEQLERNGEAYLQAQIFEDAKCLERPEQEEDEEEANPEKKEYAAADPAAEADRTFAAQKAGWGAAEKEEIRREEIGKEETRKEEIGKKEAWKKESNEKETGKREAGREDTGNDERRRREMAGEETGRETWARKEAAGEETGRGEKKGIRGIFEGKRKRGKEQREDYRQAMQQEMAGYAVAEETYYDEEPYGRTVFMEVKTTESERLHRLFAADGRLLATLDKPVFSIGKKREDADLVLENPSVSRIHARIIQEKTEVYLEDLNSTNGTYKNGLRMQPYEKRKLEEGDEIKCGTVVLTFR